MTRLKLCARWSRILALALALLSYSDGASALEAAVAPAAGEAPEAGAGDAAADTTVRRDVGEASTGQDAAAWLAGEASADGSTGIELADPSYVDVLVKLGLGLGLVVILAWGMVWLLRRSSLGQQFGGVGSAVRVVERTFLGPKRAVYLVEIGDRTLALGVTEANIALLAEWAAGELTVEPPARPVSAFGTQLKSLLGQMSNSDIASESAPTREG